MMTEDRKKQIVKASHYFSMFVRGYQVAKAREAHEQGNHEEAKFYLMLVAVSYIGVIAGFAWNKHYQLKYE